MRGRTAAALGNGGEVIDVRTCPSADGLQRTKCLAELGGVRPKEDAPRCQ